MATFRTWIFILFLLVGGPIIAFAAYGNNGRIAKVLDHGKTATAEVSKVEWSTKRGLAYDYKLLVTFTPEGGAPTKVKVPVDDTTGKAAADDELQTLAVKYLPEDPTVVYQANAAQPSNFGYYAGAGMFVAGFAMLAFRRRAKQPQPA